MTGVFRGDFMLPARLGGLLGVSVWGFLTQDTIVLPIAIPAGLVLFASVLLTLHAARGGRGAERAGAVAMLADLLTSSLWMIANGGNPFALSFVITLIVAAVATFRLGLPGLAAGAAAYVLGRVGQEAVRVALGRPTAPLQLLAEVPIAGLTLLLTALVYFAFRAERLRSARALGLSQALGRLTSDITAETDVEAVFRSITRSAAELVDAQHVTMSVRVGDAYRPVAGAGSGERVLGVTVPQGLGVIGDVLRERRTVFTPNYPLHPSALPHIVALGVRSVIGLPILVNGELAACLSVGRAVQRPLDAEDVAALEGLAAHATVALRNARLRERSQALERLSLALVHEGAPENLIERVAVDIERTFHVDFVNVMALEGGRARSVASRGAAEPLRHLVDELPAPWCAPSASAGRPSRYGTWESMPSASTPRCAIAGPVRPKRSRSRARWALARRSPRRSWSTTRSPPSSWCRRPISTGSSTMPTGRTCSPLRRRSALRCSPPRSEAIASGAPTA